jgi:hypothetical protein
MSDVNAITKALKKRTAAVGWEFVTVMKGTPKEAVVPRCLLFELNEVDVQAALRQQDFELVSLILLALDGDSELSAVSQLTVRQRDALAASPIADILLNGGVASNSDIRDFRFSVLTTEGASRGDDEGEGEHGGGRFLSTALMKSKHKNKSPRSLMRMTTANSDEMIQLGLDMVTDGILENVHVHQTGEKKATRCVWFEFVNMNVGGFDKQKFTNNLRVKSGVSWPKYVAQRKTPTARAASNSNDATRLKYSAWEWPGACTVGSHTGTCERWWCNRNEVDISHLTSATLSGENGGDIGGGGGGGCAAGGHVADGTAGDGAAAAAVDDGAILAGAEINGGRSPVATSPPATSIAAPQTPPRGA